MAIVKVTESDMQQIRSATAKLREYFTQISLKQGRPLTYNLLTYGCQLNESDSEKLAGMLRQMGLVPVEIERGGEELVPADVVVMNTCSVRENADDRLFGNLGVYKRHRRDNPGSLVIVCGCMMKLPGNVEKISKSYPFVDLVFDPQQLHKFPLLLWEAVQNKKLRVDISESDYIAEDELVPIERARKFRALVPIMYGCNNFCTYCVVPYSRGRERSRDFDSIVAELKMLADEGYREVMLLGQNVNSYAGGSKTFAAVLRAAGDIKEFSRVRFMSSHPKDLSEEVIRLMGEYPNIEKHLHLAMQSGSDRVLKAMNRPYTIDRFMDIADSFREHVPGGSLTTDIIVGFPGETDEDFEMTLDAVKRAKFDAAFTFEYSPRPGTPAASYKNQVPTAIVKERFSRLLKVQNDLAYESNSRLVGGTYEVLIEGASKGDKQILSGRTLTNHLVNFTYPEELGEGDNLEGRLCKVKIERARPYSVDGVMEELLP